MTLALAVSMNYEAGEGAEELPDAPQSPELLAYRDDLISDMRDVMKALKSY